MRILNKLVLFTAFIATACNNTEDRKANSTGIDSTEVNAKNTATTPADSKAAVAGCYSQIYERDTSSLQLILNSDSLTGQLVYKLFEKDRNDGKFKGELKNDQLAGWYYFKSEGIMSVRQVIWKVDNGQLLPAMGEMKIKNDTMVFSDVSSLKYDSTHPFVKTICAE